MKEKINAYLSGIKLKHLLYLAVIAHFIIIVVNGVIITDYILVLLYGDKAYIYLEIEYYSWIVFPTSVAICMMLPLYVELITFQRIKVHGKMYGNSVFRCFFMLSFVIVMLIDINVQVYFLALSLFLIWPAISCSRALFDMKKTSGLRSKDRKRVKRMLFLCTTCDIIIAVLALVTILRPVIGSVLKISISPISNYLAFLAIAIMILGINAYICWLFAKEDIRIAQRHSETASSDGYQ